jgi:hypothetical protein
MPWRRDGVVAAPTGSPRWWWRILSDIGIRLGCVIFVVFWLTSRPAHGALFWIGVGGVVVMSPPLALRISVAVAVFRDPHRFDGRRKSGVRDH